MAKLSKEQKVGVGLGIVGLITAIVAATRAKAAPPGEYCCPYCTDCFPTYQELVDHVRDVHPGERIPIIIDWD